MELLHVPLKITQYLNLGDELTKLIDSTFYQTADSFRKDIEQISLARDGTSTNEVSQESLAGLYRYVYYVDQLRSKFPEDQISFTWCQTLTTKSQSKSLNSFQWEKSNLLYNIAATYSVLAVGLTSSIENLNTQYQHFQASASIFNGIASEDPKISCVDLNTTKTLEFLMLAQGMECFWLKAVMKQNIKDSMMAKLSSQIIKYYEEAKQYSQKSELIRNDWINHISDKVAYFKAVTYYRMSLIYQNDKKFGVMIKCLTECNILLSKCNLETKDSFADKVKMLLKETTRDNDFIYLQVVPDTLPPFVEPINMIQLMPLHDIMNKEFEKYQDIKVFKNLLPLELLESCNAYNERQDIFLQERVYDPINDLNNVLNQKLLSLDDVLKVKNGIHSIPIEEINIIDMSLQNMEIDNKNIQAQLETIQSLLDDEANTDRRLREDHGKLRWTLQESSELNKPFYSKIENLKQYLEKGASIDKDTKSLFETIDKDLISTNKISFPESNDPLRNKITTAENKRTKFLVTVENKSMNNKILIKVIEAYRQNNDVIDQRKFETVFQTHMNVFHEDLVTVQEEQRMNNTLNEELDNRKSDDKPEENTLKRLDQRDLYIEDFQHSLKLLGEVKQSITDGMKFYNDLTISSNTLVLDAGKFNDERNFKKKELNEKLLRI